MSPANVLRLVLASSLAFSLGCSIRISTSLGGRNFDYSGVSAARELQGALAAETASVLVQNEFGPVEVEGVEADFGWKWSLECWAASDEEAQRFVESLDLERQRDGDELRVTFKLPEHADPALRGVKSTIRLRLPVSTEVEVENAHGAVTVAGVAAPLTVNNGHGDVEITDVPAQIEAENSFGSLNARNIRSGRLKNSHGKIGASDVAEALTAETSFAGLDVERVGGDLVARNSHGGVDVQTVSGKADVRTSFSHLAVDGVAGDSVLRNRHGSIHGKNLTGRVEAETSFGSMKLEGTPTAVQCTNSHGSVELRLRNPELRELRAETSFSSLEVLVPESCPVRVDAHTTFGDVRSQLSEDADAATVLKLRNKHGNIQVARWR